MQVTMARLAEQFAPDLSPIEDAIRNVLDNSAMSRELNERIAEAIRDLPEKPGDKG
ncbi:hypothetical protein ACFUAG_35490 [Streptomyces sp. NPDC057193]